jgi:hypothetical protein
MQAGLGRQASADAQTLARVHAPVRGLPTCCATETRLIPRRLCAGWPKSIKSGLLSGLGCAPSGAAAVLLDVPCAADRTAATFAASAALPPVLLALRFGAMYKCHRSLKAARRRARATSVARRWQLALATDDCGLLNYF